MNTVSEVLDAAMAVALERGFACSGWTMQRSSEGYFAWLFAEKDTYHQVPLFDDVEVHQQALAAARACYAQIFVAVPEEGVVTQDN